MTDTVAQETAAPRTEKITNRRGVALLRGTFRHDIPAATQVRLLATVALTLLVSILMALAPIQFAQAVDMLTAGSPIGEAGIVIGLSVLFWGGAKILIEQRWWVYQPAEHRFLNAVRSRYLTHVLALPARYHADRSLGQMESVVGQGMGGLQRLMSTAFTQLAPVVFEIVVVVTAFATVISAKLAAIVAGTVGLYITILVIGSEKVSRRFRAAIDTSIMAQGQSGDAILNADGIKMLGIEGMIANRYRRAIARVHARFLAFYFARGLFGVLMSLVLIAGFGIALALALGDYGQGTLSIGGLVLVNALLLQLFRSVEGFSFSYRDSRQALTAVHRFLGLLSEPVEPHHGGDQPDLPITRVDVDGVGFDYPDGRTGLDRLSLTLERSRIVALLGPSGSGKSTLVRLLLQLYQPTRGQLRLDGVPFGSIDARALRSITSVVPQDAAMFRDTLAFNIALSDTPDGDRLAEAITAAQLGGLLTRLPQGVETEIGERGAKVSGGERQRIAIARALYRHPQILILDEATSALDEATKGELLKTIRGVAAGYVTLIITHDPVAAAIADEVVNITAHQTTATSDPDVT